MKLPSVLKRRGNITIILSSGKEVLLPLYSAVFEEWKGELPEFDFGDKPIIKYHDECIFAELALLRLFTDSGWDGVWVETFGGVHFLNSMPSSWNLKSNNIAIPKEKEDLLNSIWKSRKTKGCFDVLVWEDNNILFCESKQEKEGLTTAQKKFIEGAMSCGIREDSLLIVKWDYKK